MKELAIIVGIYGRIEDNINGIGRIMKAIKKYEQEVQLNFVFEDAHWYSLPVLQMSSYMLSDCNTYLVSDAKDLPAKLFNNAIKRVNGEYIAFWDANVLNISDRIEKFLCERDADDCNYPIMYLQKKTDKIVIPDNGNRYGLLQTNDYYMMYDFFIRKDYMEDNFFNENPILQNHFFREWVLRSALQNDFYCIGSIDCSENYMRPIHQYRTHADILQRYIIRCGAFGNKISRKEIDISFVNDLKGYEYRRIKDYFTDCIWNEKMAPRYKIMILGGYYEYHHNQIVFMNYLEKVIGEGFATFNVKLDCECKTLGTDDK